MKNRILLDNYYLPGQLEQSIEELVRYYNNCRYHESLDNLTPSLRLCALDRKKFAAFSALGGGFLRFPIGDRRCNRTRASVGNAAGTRAQAVQTRL